MKIFLASVIAFVSSSVYAQTSRPVYPDAGLWNTFSASYKLSKKTSLLFTQEVRLRENYGRLNLLYNNFGVSHTIVKGLKTAVIYRLIDKYLENNTFSFRHRMMWDMSYKKSFGKLEASYRHRFQLEWRDFYSSPLGRSPEVFSRNKVELNYLLGKWSPFYSSEIRIQFTDPRNNDDDDNLSRNRNIIGVDYTLNKYSTAGLYFLYQREFNTATPQIIYITGLQYDLDISKLIVVKKSDKKKKAKAAKNID